ncbi:DNA/RNA helicase, superfamily II domain protein [Ralstonia insidiosa]|uniref:DNA/RNA helicase, superfamily II domain protein n=1 Tax=Ralstonia insidiosa TaxID=190721 RepID=A0AAC9BIU8_9RALS|nr:DNA/RNA helicase, superfamily II domain protein [Ralstonia insidiosa]
MLAQTMRRRWRPYCAVAVVTCRASSRVGVSTSSDGLAGLGRGRRPFMRCGGPSMRGRCGSGCSLMRWMAGRMKAAVLPEPVWLVTSRSRPDRQAGMACACTGVGVV